MRRELTNAESQLRQRLRRNQLGVRFRSQVAIVRSIVDFYCPSRRLVLEVDGVRTTLEAMGTRNVTAS
jgi:very-short-patch-repair endonuclease